MLQPSSQSATDKLSADDFAKFFVDKVAKIRASTAAAAAPVISPRDVLPLTELEPTSVHVIIKLLSTLPAKSCSLDPVPTWLLKRISATIYPILCHLCSLSFQSTEARSSDTASKKARIGPRHCQLLQAHIQFIIYLQTRRTSCHQALHEPCQPTHSASSPTIRLPTVPLYSVYMDSELTMKEHVAKIAAACFYHIRHLRQVRRRIGQEVTQ